MQAWWRAAHLHDVADAFDALAAHASDVVECHRPVCLASGACCHFGEHGHVLLVTGLEAVLIWRRGARVDQRAARHSITAERCPHLDGKHCSIHALRPVGCRAYFCDPSAHEWQRALGESMHAAVRRIHDDHSIPYLLAEWTWLLDAVATSDAQGLLRRELPL